MQLFLSPDFNIRTLRKSPKSCMQKFKEKQQEIFDSRLHNIGNLLKDYIPRALFNEDDFQKKKRRRLFCSVNTFWGLFLQTLQSDGSCQSIVHQFKAFAQKVHGKPMSASTSAYCQARKRLPIELLNNVFEHTHLRGNCAHPLVNRRVVCADGTGLLASDTRDNQEVWPQQANQKVGCAFPQIRLCALFNLQSGIALDYKLGNKRSHELPLLRAQESSFREGDVFIGDKGFICYYDQARLLELGVDSIVALAKRKPVLAKHAKKKISDGYLVITVPKFTSTSARKRYPEDKWNALPESIDMRQIQVDICIPGYRTERVYLLTTLLDSDVYPAESITEIYRQRWRIEIFFRDLKSTLGMEFLRAKTPEMVKKEIKMFFIVNNIIRLLILDSWSHEENEKSFKSSTQILQAYSENGTDNLSKSISFLIGNLLKNISECRLLKRPDRVEPRVVKLRPKPFKMMMKPRPELRRELCRRAA
ncbi:MAG: IS4 family transposase [Acidiferrobacterales bacterium]|nr:IS4 family transposase [Acidiferrobacterales bacterium]